MSNLLNIKKSIYNTLNAATSTIAVSTTVLADATLLASNAISATPKVAKELALTPFNAAEGYLEENGLTTEEAHMVAFKYLDQDAHVTVRELGKGSGKLLASILDDLDEDVDNANTATPEASDKEKLVAKLQAKLARKEAAKAAH